MKKTDKKIEKKLRESLTEVCETALETVTGFKWLTHEVNYQNFPASLRVICVFNNNDDLTQILNTQQDIYLRSLIKEKLATVNIPLNNLYQQISFDSELGHANKSHKNLIH